MLQARKNIFTWLQWGSFFYCSTHELFQAHHVFPLGSMRIAFQRRIAQGAQQNSTWGSFLTEKMLPQARKNIIAWGFFLRMNCSRHATYFHLTQWGSLFKDELLKAHCATTKFHLRIVFNWKDVAGAHKYFLLRIAFLHLNCSRYTTHPNFRIAFIQCDAMNCFRRSKIFLFVDRFSKTNCLPNWRRAIILYIIVIFYYCYETVSRWIVPGKHHKFHLSHWLIEDRLSYMNCSRRAKIFHLRITFLYDDLFRAHHIFRLGIAFLHCYKMDCFRHTTYFHFDDRFSLSHRWIFHGATYFQLDFVRRFPTVVRDEFFQARQK